jgi:hypothetical protein
MVQEACAAIGCSGTQASGEAGAAAYISSMANRPCKPDDDLKKLWQSLLPGIAMPACGTAADDAPRERETATLQEKDQANTTRDALRSKQRRR